MDSHPVEDTVSAQQLEAVLRETNLLTAALKRARQVRLAIVVVLVLFVVTLALVMKSRADELTSEKYLNRLAEVASRRLEQRKDHYMRQLEALVNKVGPPLNKAFLDQARKDMPLYMKAIEKEREPFLKSFPAKFEERINKRYKNLHARYDSLMRKEFPQLRDEKVQARMAANLDLAVESLLRKYYVQDLVSEIETLYATWDKLPPAVAPAKDDQPLEEQFLGSLLDLLSYRLTHVQGLPLTVGTVKTPNVKTPNMKTPNVKTGTPEMPKTGKTKSQSKSGEK